MVTTRPPKTIVKPTAFGPVANTDTKFLIYGLFQKGRVLAQDGNKQLQERASIFALDSFDGYRSREAASGASDSWLETIKKRAKQVLSV